MDKEKKMTRSEKMYANSPKLERNEEGKMSITRKNASADNAGTDNAAHGADLPEHTKAMVDLMEKHASERLDMHNKHLKEHMDTMHKMAKMSLPTDQQESEDKGE